MKIKKRLNKNIKKCGALLLVTAITGTSLGFDNIIKAANDEQFINTDVIYNDDKTQADIKFDISAVDKEKYEVTSITSDSDGKVVYQKKETDDEETEKSVKYTVAKNGTYDFTVKYVENEQSNTQETELSTQTQDDKTSSESVNTEMTLKDNAVVPQSDENVIEQASKTSSIDEKTTIVSVDVEGIKIETEKSKNVDLNDLSNQSNKLNTLTSTSLPRIDGNQNIDMRNTFTYKSYAYNTANKDKLDISERSSGNVGKNTVKMMNPEYTDLFPGGLGNRPYFYQLTALQSKYTLDFRRPFTLTAQLSLGDGMNTASDGLAVSFTSDSTFIDRYTGKSGGSLGVYNGGLTKGIVSEIDTWGNDSDDSNSAAYGDKDDGRWDWNKHAHIDINGVVGKSVTHLHNDSDPANNWKIGSASNIQGTNTFEISWNPDDSSLYFQYGTYKIKSSQIDVSKYLENPEEVYLIFSSATGSPGVQPGKPVENTFTFETFKYNDIDLQASFDYVRVEGLAGSPGYGDVAESYDYSTPVKDRDISKFLQPGQVAKVKFTFRNNRKNPLDISEKLYIDQLDINGTKVEILPTSCTYETTDGRSGMLFGLNRGDPIDVFYPKNQGIYTLYFSIKIPESFSYDITQSSNNQLPQVNLSVKIGIQGMEQKTFSKKLSYVSKPVVKGIDKNIDVNSDALESNYEANHLAQVHTYDDPVFHSLSEGPQNGYSTSKEGWYRFNYKTDSFESISKNQFSEHSLTTKGETDLYLYAFKAQEARRGQIASLEAPISDEGYGRYFLNKGSLTSSNGYKLILSNDTITINASDIASKYNSNEKLLEYLQNQLSIKAYDDNGGMNVRKADKLELNSAGLNFTTPEAKTYIMNVNVYDSDYNSGNSIALTKQINVIVTPSPVPSFNFLNGIQVNGNGTAQQNVAITYDVSTDLNNYAVPGNEITVRFNIVSDNQANHKVGAKLTITKLQIPGTNITLTPKGLTYTPYRLDNGVLVEDGPKISIGDVKVGQSVDVEIPAKGKQMLYEFKVTIPEDASININDFASGTLPYLETSVSLQTIGSSTAVSKDLNMAVASKPFVDGHDTTSKVQSTIDKNTILENGYAKAYDENLKNLVDWHKLSSLNSTYLKINSEKYYRFDKAQNKFVDSSESQMTANQIETGIYAYEFDVKDTRHSGKNNNGGLISNKAIIRNFVGNKTASSDGKYVILTSDDNITLSETQIVKDYYTKSLLEDYIINELSVKGYIDNGELNITNATKIVLNDSGFDYTNPKEGKYTMSFELYDGSAVKLTQTVTVNITSNTWSYDTDDRTEQNGASGFIVIPKYIELEKSSDKKNITATEEVYFASYSNATNVQYKLYVDKTFELTKKGDPSSQVEVVSSSDTGLDSSDNRWYVGELNRRYIKGFGQNVTFTAPSDEVDKSKGIWQGTVTFYFERK